MYETTTSRLNEQYGVRILNVWTVFEHLDFVTCAENTAAPVNMSETGHNSPTTPTILTGKTFSVQEAY